MTAAAVVAVVAGLVSGCGPTRRPAPACAGPRARPAAVVGQSSKVDADLPSGPEALWTADRSGTLRAFTRMAGAAVATIDIGRPAYGSPVVVTGGGLVWVYRHDSGVILVDPATSQIKARANVPAARPLWANRLYFGHGALWIAQPGRLWRVDSSGKASSTALPAGFAPIAVAATNRWLWLSGGRRIVRVNPQTRRVEPAANLPAAASTLVSTGGRLAAANASQPQVLLLDPRSAKLQSVVNIPGGEVISGLYASRTDIWVTGKCGNVHRVAGPRTARPQTVRISKVPQDMPAAVSAGSFWVADKNAAQLLRVDLGTAAVRARLPVLAASPPVSQSPPTPPSPPSPSSTASAKATPVGSASASPRAVPAATPGSAFAVVAGRHSVWLVDDHLAKGVSLVDPAGNQITRLTPPDGAVGGVSAAVGPAPG